MYRRTRSREVALQLLFQRDLNPGMDRAAIETFVRLRLNDQRAFDECVKLFDAFIGKAEEIDRLLTEASDNWRVSRMGAVDRNVLRLGAIELIAADLTAPPAVVIDEAIELARRFGTADSPAFVNGVLDKVRQSLETPTAQV
jgi:transcription antitermination protein NusB